MGSLLCCRNKAGQRTVTTPHRLITKNEMGKFDGSFKLECQSNLAAAFKAMGVPDADTKRYLDPKNSVIYTITEKSDGAFETKSTISDLPEWNQTSSFKLGVRTELKTPFEHAVTMTKKDENTFCMKTEMGGKVMESSMQHHNYGISISGCVDGVCFSEEFKKMEPKFSGFYKFESETGMGPLMKAMGIPTDGLSAETMVNMGFRVVDKGDKIWLEEHYGDKKEYMAVLNQEYDYERPEWNMCEKRVTTKVGPGSYKTVSKCTKTGRITESTVTFTDTGCSVDTSTMGLKAHETFKKGADFQGKWRAVAMTGDLKKQYLDGALKETFDVERLVNGCFKIKTDSPFVPGGVMVMKSGESICVDLPGMGKTENIGYEGCDSWLQVTKCMGKTVTTKETISGDFLIAEATVENCPSSAATTIFTRD